MIGVLHREYCCFRISLHLAEWKESFYHPLCLPCRTFPIRSRGREAPGRALTWARGFGEAVAAARQQRQHLQRDRQPEEHGSAAEPRRGACQHRRPREPPGPARPGGRCPARGAEARGSRCPGLGPASPRPQKWSSPAPPAAPGSGRSRGRAGPGACAAPALRGPRWGQLGRAEPGPGPRCSGGTHRAQGLRCTRAEREGKRGPAQEACESLPASYQTLSTGLNYTAQAQSSVIVLTTKKGHTWKV